MKQLSLFLLLLVGTLFLTSCNDDDDAPSQKSLRRVVVVYIMGENSLTTMATDDLSEIRAGASQIPDDCRMVVFFDNSSTTTMPQILSFDSTNGEQLLYQYPEDVVSTEGDVMESVLQYIVNGNPAEEYALILWSHGSGWAPASSSAKSYTIGIDNGKNTTSNTGVEMEITTLRSVLSSVGVHWKYILYDACFMQCVEVAYELRQLTEWSLGSVAEIPDRGAPYDKLMPYFFASATFQKDIIEQYYDDYAASSGVLLSAIRSDALEGLATATAAAIRGLDAYPTDGLQAYCAYASATAYKPEYYDMGSCIYHWAGQSAYDTWETAMTTAVPYRYVSSTWPTSYSRTFSPRITDADHIALISMYFPIAGRDALNNAWRKYEWYTDVGYLFENNN